MTLDDIKIEIFLFLKMLMFVFSFLDILFLSMLICNVHLVPTYVCIQCINLYCFGSVLNIVKDSQGSPDNVFLFLLTITCLLLFISVISANL